MSPLLVTLAIGAAAGLTGLVLLYMLWQAFWQVAEPNQALVISGLRHQPIDGAGESLGFKIITGKGTMVLPGIQRVRTLSLDLQEAELDIHCVTTQGIPVNLKGVVIYKVGDDYASIANAARRFLDQQDRMAQRVQGLFAGHLRAIVGTLNVEDLIRDREKLAEGVRTQVGTEMQKLGLIVDALLIQEITDSVQYIVNIAAPHQAAVERDAKIAQAQAHQASSQKEQEALALVAQYERDTNIKKAYFEAETNRAKAEAEQAGPLTSAKAKQAVVVEETHVAELTAARTAKELETQIQRPADANAYQVRVTAEGARDAQVAYATAQAKTTELNAEANARQIKITGEAEGDAIRARGLAEASAIQARAEALATNPEAVIGQQLAERWPEIVANAAKPFGDIDQMIVLNGAEGMNDMLGKAMGMAVTALPLLRQALANQATQPAPPVQPLEPKPALDATNGEAPTKPEALL